jgi:hypothetical protein
MQRVRSFLRLLALSPVAVLGAALATVAFIAYFALAFGEVFLFQGNPYWGIVLNVVFPAIAIVGLILIAAGLFFKARAMGSGFSFSALAALAEKRQIRGSYAWQVVVALTTINIVVFGLFSYRGYHFTESREFCGELCHTVMEPEYTVYKLSPHSEISCTACHIGAGATWFVKSKLSGTRQVYAVLTKTYSRPIETPVHSLRPAREVCEVCHRPEIFHGDRIRVIDHFAPDQENTHTYTVLNVRVGGGGEKAAPHGIHWHVGREHVVRYYASDRKREKIDWIDLTGPADQRRSWTRPGQEISEDTIDPEQIRTMDCIDCHNRPTHIYPPPGVALDDLLARKVIDPRIPWIRKYAEEVLTREYATSEAAMQGIAELTSIYQQREPETWAACRGQIEAAVPHLQETHRLYVYPYMRVRWNTYPSLIGHPESTTLGCFRCHDGILRDQHGETITADCDVCHHVLAREQSDPAILRILAGQ